MFWATVCPSSGEITASVRHLAFVTLCGWLSGMQGPPCIPDSHPHRITITKCRINTVFSPDDGYIVVQNMYRKEINILRKIVHQVGCIYKIFPQDLPTKTFYKVFVPNLGHGNVCNRTMLSVTHLNDKMTAFWLYTMLNWFLSFLLSATAFLIIWFLKIHDVNVTWNFHRFVDQV